MNDISKEKKFRRRSIKQRIDAKHALANAKGMTIVELMIVLTIIASIMGVVGFYVFGALDKANIKNAEIEIKQLNNLVEAYYLSASPRGFPNQLEDLTEGPSPLTKEIPKDPWGADYVYRKVSNREFTIISPGPDGIEGNEDDIGRSESDG